MNKVREERRSLNTNRVKHPPEWVGKRERGGGGGGSILRDEAGAKSE